jgi:hypothetical protein
MMLAKSPIPATFFTRPCNAKPTVARRAGMELSLFHFIQIEEVRWAMSR